jgi:hypothetical protein
MCLEIHNPNESCPRKQVVAFSGGKDSTAMVLRMAELGEDFDVIFTPTMDEPLGVYEFIGDIEARLGKKIICPKAPTLMGLIRQFKALPNWRQRWCTRLIKIVPCIEYLKAHPGTTLCVGLRADEPERIGLYGDYAAYRYPLREWNWGLFEILGYLYQANIRVPRRTNCRLCYDQGIRDWWWLWQTEPGVWALGEELEAEYGHTFRSPSRDTWPASLSELRQVFESGRKPRGLDKKPKERCKVCQM